MNANRTEIKDIVFTNGTLWKILIKTSQSKIAVKFSTVETTIKNWEKKFQNLEILFTQTAM